MCGFAGFIDFKRASDFIVLKTMTDSLIHRGPDDAGYELIQGANCSIGFGFRRLSIIDLSPLGHQPMFNLQKDIVVMLNGEIYNYKELKNELIDQGVSFVSNSDTEVVLQSYMRYGVSCVNKFIGMFSIVILDRSLDKVFLIRDRAGIKPLFYYFKENLFLFASELKAFHLHPEFKKKISDKAVGEYFYYGNIPAPLTIFEDTYKVVPGSIVELNLKNSTYKTFSYWDVLDVYNKKSLDISYQDALKETERLLESAFNYRLVSDVPVGVFLSGGYDSSAVAALLSKSGAKINTFTIGFEESKYDESPYAKNVAQYLNANHFEYYCTIKDALNIVPFLPEIYDEPFGDPSAIPTTLVSKIARQHVTVALSADGGDELFAGYSRHKKAKKYIKNLSLLSESVRKSLAFLIENIPFSHSGISVSDRREKLVSLLKSKSDIEAFHIINQTYTKGEIKKLMKVPFDFSSTIFEKENLLELQSDQLNKILAIEYKSYLVDDILQKVDRATMSVSLEGREPFLDHRLVEFLSTLPSHYKLSESGQSKKLLKDIVHNYVPQKLLDRPKMGFGLPIDNWLKNELRDLFEEIFNESFLSEQTVLNGAEVMNLKRAYLNGEIRDFERLWFVFTFLQWYKKWM